MWQLNLNHQAMEYLHRAKLLTKQIERQTSAALMNEEHVKDRKLNDSLVRTGTNSVESARQVPLCRAVELSLPHHRTCRAERKEVSSASLPPL